MSRSFDGATNRIDWSAVANLTGAALTISAWIYHDTFTGNDYVFCAHQSGDAAFGIILYAADSNDKILLTRAGTTSLTRGGYATASLLGAWHHVLVTHDGTFNDYTKIHIYFDGTEAGSYASGANGATEANATGSWSLGGRIYDDQRGFDGLIAEFAVWNSVLDSTTITALAGGNAPSYYPTGLQFYYSAKSDTLVAETGGTGTADGSTYNASHPTITYPSTATAVPIFLNQYRQRVA